MRNVDERFTPEERAAQTLYWKFTVWNRGYEWVDIHTGKIMGKAEMWSRYYNDEKELIRVTEDIHPRYRKRLKPDWVVYQFKNGGSEVILKEEVARLKREEKKMLEKIKKQQEPNE